MLVACCNWAILIKRTLFTPLCYSVCEQGTFGVNCSEACDCGDGARCDPVTGACVCGPGKTGARCDTGELLPGQCKSNEIICCLTTRSA